MSERKAWSPRFVLGTALVCVLASSYRTDSGKRFIAESEARQATTHLVIGSEIGCRYVAGSPAEVVVLEQNPGQVFTLSSRTRTVLGCACARSDTLASLGPKVRLDS
jgi:hypothetical protein